MAAFFVTVASFLGFLHPAGDSFAVFRRPIAAFLLLAALFASGRTQGLAVIFAAVSMSSTVAWRQDGPEEMTIYVRNLLADNTQIERIAAEIEARSPEIVALQEVSKHNRALLKRLAGTYPHQHFCHFSDWSGMAILSKTAATEQGRCSATRGLAAMPIKHANKTLWAVSVHLHLPWPLQDGGPLDDFVSFLGDLDGPRVLAGDFNMVHWGYAPRKLARSVGVTRATGSGPTFRVARHIWVAIDHVYAPGGGRAERLPKFGSDHHGLLARVSLSTSEVAHKIPSAPHR